MCEQTTCECKDYYAYRFIFKRAKWFALILNETMCVAHSASRISSESFHNCSCFEFEGELFYVPTREDSYNSYVLKREIAEQEQISLVYWWGDLLNV